MIFRPLYDPKSGLTRQTALTVSEECVQGRRDGSTRDEPFAWESREFLRKLAIGKPCVFRIDYKLDIAGGKEFGSVFVDESENLSVASVAAGWCRVREGGAQQSPFYESLKMEEMKAKTKHLGLHKDDPKLLSQSVRNINVDTDGNDAMKKYGKGASLDAIVESVISGSMMRITLLPELQSMAVMLAGVQCPNMGKKGPVVQDSKTEQPIEKASGADANEVQAEPFAKEARHFAEMRCLNRDVKLVLQGVSQFGVLIVSLQFPLPKEVEADSPFVDLGTSLMKAGLGKTAEWSLNMMVNGAFTLREAERSARANRAGMWHNYVPQTGNSTKLDDHFSGTVSEIVSGDCVVVTDNHSGIERRVMLSSIRAPRAATRDKLAEPWGTEAKEFLRNRLIGKTVTVKMDYTRKIPFNTNGSAKPEERIMAFGTIQIPEKNKDGEIKINNVAEFLLIRGLAQTVRHKGDEERSGTLLSFCLCYIIYLWPRLPVLTTIT